MITRTGGSPGLGGEGYLPKRRKFRRCWWVQEEEASSNTQQLVQSLDGSLSVIPETLGRPKRLVVGWEGTQETESQREWQDQCAELGFSLRVAVTNPWD